MINVTGKTPGFSGRGGESLADIFSSKVWQLDFYNVEYIWTNWVFKWDQIQENKTNLTFIPLKDGAFVPNKHRAFLMDTQVKYTIVSQFSRWCDLYHNQYDNGDGILDEDTDDNDEKDHEFRDDDDVDGDPLRDVAGS